MWKKCSTEIHTSLLLFPLVIFHCKEVTKIGTRNTHMNSKSFSAQHNVLQLVLFPCSHLLEGSKPKNFKLKKKEQNRNMSLRCCSCRLHLFHFGRFQVFKKFCHLITHLIIIEMLNSTVALFSQYLLVHPSTGEVSFFAWRSLTKYFCITYLLV